jgi:hypothetical protein
LKNSFSVVSSSGLLTFDPALNRQTSIGPMLLFDFGEQALNLGFLTGIDAERVNVMARGFQFVDQPWDLARRACRCRPYSRPWQNAGRRPRRWRRLRRPVSLRRDFPPSFSHKFLFEYFNHTRPCRVDCKRNFSMP